MESTQQYVSNPGLLKLFPKSLIEFFDGVSIKLLIDNVPTPKHKLKEEEKLRRNRDLRALLTDRDFGNYTQWVDDDGSVTIHQRVRNQDELNIYACTEQILHEMGHLMETTDDRLTLRDWGLKWPKDYKKSSAVPASGLRRELRASIYNIALRRLLNIPLKPKYSFQLESMIYSVLGLENVNDVLEFPELQYLSKEFNFKTCRLSQVVIKYTHDEAAKITDEELMDEWDRRSMVIAEKMSQQLELV